MDEGFTRNSLSVFDGHPKIRTATTAEILDRPETNDKNLPVPLVPKNQTAAMLRFMQYRNFDGAADGVTNVVIDTPKVPSGSYWYVQAAAVASVGAGFGLFLMPPNLVGSGAPNLNDTYVQGVRVDGGGGSLPRGIIIPPDWFLRFASFGGAAPAAKKYGLFLAYAELPLSFDAIELLT